MTNFIRVPLLAVMLTLTAGCGIDKLMFDSDPCENAPTTVGRILITPVTLSLTRGTNSQVTAVVSSPDGARLNGCGPAAYWRAADPAIATVEGSWEGAIVTAVGAGSTVITMSRGGKNGSALVTVTNSAAAGVKSSDSR